MNVRHRRHRQTHIDGLQVDVQLRLPGRALLFAGRASRVSVEHDAERSCWELIGVCTLHTLMPGAVDEVAESK